MSPSGTETTQIIQAEDKLLFTVVVAFLILMALLLAGGRRAWPHDDDEHQHAWSGSARSACCGLLARRMPRCAQIVLAEGLAMAAISWGMGTVLSSS